MTIRNAETMGTVGATWEARGYCGQGPVGALCGALAGRSAIVCGSGRGVFDELAEAQAALHDPVIFAVNDIGMYLPRVDHWVSLHVDNLIAWRQVRWLHPKARELTKYHSETPRAWLDYCWDGLTPILYLSGYFAMQLAWIMGCDRIVLCGCPGDATPRFFEATLRSNLLLTEPNGPFSYGSGDRGADRSVHEQIQQEMERLPEFKAAVRSMSGITQQFFGGL